MYIHIGGQVVLKTDRILGIFDMENTTVSPRTRPLLSQMQAAGRVITAGDELPRSMVLARGACGAYGAAGGNEREDVFLYLTPVSTATLYKRQATDPRDV